MWAFLELLVFLFGTAFVVGFFTYGLWVRSHSIPPVTLSTESFSSIPQSISASEAATDSMMDEL